jgi:hypothetical protein
MIKRRRTSAKATLREQEVELKRTARGKRFVGEDTGSAQARAAERAKVHQMLVASREASLRAQREREARRAHEERVHRPLWEGVADLVVDTARLAGTIARLPFRVAKLPFRVAAALLPRWSGA